MSGQRRSQRATQTGRATFQSAGKQEGYSDEMNEQLVSPNPHDQAQRWGTRDYSQQVYGQQGMENQGRTGGMSDTVGTGAYHGVGTGSYNPRETHRSVGSDEYDDEPFVQTYSDEPSTGRSQRQQKDEGSEQSGGMFGGIGQKMHDAMGGAAKKAEDTLGSGSRGSH